MIKPRQPDLWGILEPWDYWVEIYQPPIPGKEHGVFYYQTLIGTIYFNTPDTQITKIILRGRDVCSFNFDGIFYEGATAVSVIKNEVFKLQESRKFSFEEALDYLVKTSLLRWMAYPHFTIDMFFRDGYVREDYTIHREYKHTMQVIKKKLKEDWRLDIDIPYA